MAAKVLPPQELLLQLFRYEPETGKLFWRERSAEHFCGKKYPAQRLADAWNLKLSGKEALTSQDGKGYKCGSFDGRTVRAHRVIWKMIHGSDPNQIDHVNGNRSGNREINLRAVDNAENHKNMRISAANKSGVTGVRLFERTGRWVSEITIHGKSRHLGFYATKPEAIAARKAAERLLGFHRNHGKSG